MLIQKKRVFAETDPDMIDEAPEMDEDEGDVNVAPEASELLFETDDVAQLIAEVTGEPVDVTADEDQVVFAVGDEKFTVEPDGDEELLEAVRKPFKNKRPVKASANQRGRRIEASRKAEAAKAPKTIRKVPSTKK